MAFYKSIYTGTEIDQRLTQATYDDAVLAGFEGSKEEFDAILGKLKEIADKAENSTQMESEDLETFNKNIVDAINELHRELQAKPDEQDVIDQGELEVFKDEIAAKYATKGEIEGDIKDVNSKISTLNNNLVESVNTINKNVNDSLTIVNQAIQQNAETIVAEIEQRKEADKEVLAKITEGDTNLQKDLQTLNQNLVQSINQINENVANGFNTINSAINDELRPNIENNKTNITQLQETVAIVNTNLYESVETINTALNNAINTINGGIATEISDRQNADTELDSKITQEISDRTAAIVSLDSTLRNEITQRKNADITLDSMIRQEMSNRQTADDQLSERIETLENAGYQNADQVKVEIEKIIDAAPEALDTLKEIGDALNNDPDFAATMTNELSKKADKTELDTKVDWVDYNNTKNIVLPSNGQIFGDFGGEESNSSLLGARIYNAGLENEEKQVEVGTSKVHLNLNSLDKPTIETPDGKENLVVESDIELIPTEVNFPIRTSGGSDGPEDRIYTQEEILEWFGVTDIAALKTQIANKGIQYIKYGISLMGNPYYYKMPVQYAAFESATQIKLVFVGLNTRDDAPSKYEIIINLDGTIIEGNSNIKVTITSIESGDIDLSEYATKEELNDYALKSELPDVSDFVTKEEVPSVFETKGLTELETGESNANIEAALGIDFTSLIEIIRENKTIIVDRNSAGDYKACIHATGNISSGNGAANLMFFIGTTPTIYQVQYVNGTFALAVDEYEFAMKSELPDTSNFATKLELNTKQDTLVSGTNIKTLNGVSLLGSGDIQFEEGSGDYTNISNKPSINGVELSGNKTSDDLGLAAKSDIPNVSEFVKESELPTQYIVEEGAALQAGDEQHEFNIKSGGRVTVNSANEVVTYTPYPGEEGRKMLVLANNDSLTGTKTDGTGAPLAFMSKWDKIEIGNSTTSLNLNSLNGEITINDDKIVATTDQIQAPYEINLTNLLSAEDSESISTAIGGIDNLNATVQDNRIIVGTISNGSISVSIRILGNVTTLYYLLDSVVGLTLNEIAITNTSSTLSKNVTTHSVLTENMVINSLDLDETTLPLSAAQGKVLNSDKQNKTDETLQTTDKTIVGAINELLAKVQELETKNTELESRLAALEGTN